MLEGGSPARAPWYYRLAMFLKRNRYRGGDRILTTAGRLGLLNRVVRYPVGGGLSLDVPLFRTDNQWDEELISRYEPEFVRALADAARSFEPPVQLVDCGADIGTFAVLVSARFPRFSRVTAFEPNGEVFPFLEGNLRRLGVPADARNAAVSDFRGRGALGSTERDRSDWARFLVRDERGPVRVERIDDLAVEPGTSLVVKIDVEGGELDVIRGASGALASAPRFAVGFEAHRQVIERTRIDPTECVRHLRAIRPCRVVVAEEPSVELDVERPFLEQVGDRHVYNVVCVSIPTGAPPARG